MDYSNISKGLSTIHQPYKHKLFEFWRQISVLILQYCGLIFILIAVFLSKSERELSVTVCLLLFRKRNSEITPLFGLKEKHQNSKSLCLYKVDESLTALYNKAEGSNMFT